MPPLPDAENWQEELPQPRPLPPGLLTTLRVVWPAFVMAGVLEMMTFAALDPETLHSWNGEPFGWSRSAVYTVTFFIFWAVISAASAITQWLYRSERT